MVRRTLVSPDKMLGAIVEEMLYVQARYESLRRSVAMMGGCTDDLETSMGEVSGCMDDTLDSLTRLSSHELFEEKMTRSGFLNAIGNLVLFK